MVSVREVDWAMGPIRRRVQHLEGALQFVWRARRAERMVVCTAGTPLVVAALAKRLVARRTEFIAVDFLRPPRLPSWALKFGLRSVDRFVVVRRGDIEILSGLGYPRERCRFVEFPGPDLSDFVASHVVRSEAFVYSGGNAQRDWVTLFEALRQARVPAVVSCPDPTVSVSSNVEKLGQVRPDQGRSWLAQSEFLVMAVFDNDLPSGPLLLLDAFALGRCVVATDTNGTRDYIRPGENGILVPPDDPEALAEAVRDLFGSPDRIRTMGQKARATATKLTAERFWSEVLR